MKFITNYKFLTDPEKAVVALMSIDKDVASYIMDQFSDSELVRIANVMMSLGAVDYPVVEYVIKEIDLTLNSPGIIIGNEEITQKTIAGLLSVDKSKKILQKLGTEDIEPGIWHEINNTPINDLVGFLMDTNPQTAALILSKLSLNRATNVLNIINTESACKIVFSLLETVSPPQNVLNEIEDTIYEEFVSSRSQSFDAVRLVADIVQDLDKERATAIQKYIDSISPTMSEAINALMLSFDDIVCIGEDGIKLLMESADREKLLIALRGAQPKVREAFLEFLPTLARNLLQNDIDMIGNVSAAQLKSNQSYIMQLLMKLEREGKIQIER